MTLLPRPLLVCLVCLAAALVAGCTMTRTPAVGQQGAILATATMTDAEAQNGADLMGENQATTTLGPTAIPTADPLLAQMADEVKAANERADSALKLVNDQTERISQNAKAASEANERSAIIELTKVTKSGEIAVSLAEQTTAQKQEDNKATLLQVQRDEAQAAAANANSNTVRTLAILAVCVSLVLLAVRALARHPIPVPVTHGENVTRPLVPTGEGPNSYHVRELPVDAGVMYRFVAYATQGKPLGTGSMESAHVFKSTERWARTEIITYLDKIGHLAHDTGLVLTDAAIAYWLDWMQKYSPNLTPEVAETVTYSRHDHVNHGHVAAENAEGGMVDDFNIMPQPDPFLPTGPTLNAGIDPQKDEEK